MRTKIYRPFTIEPGKIQRNYSSVQLNLPVALANEITSWGYKTIPERSIFSDPDNPSFGRENNMHITVLNGIETVSENLVSSLFKGRNSFEVKLGNMSLFNNNAFDVLKIEVCSLDLHDLNSILVRNLDVVQNYPDYIPHVTIAYLKKDKGRDYVGCQKFSERKFEVNKLIFSSKNGNKYNIEFGEK